MRNIGLIKGQSLLELCLLIPFFFLLLFGGIEVGITFHNWLVVLQAARAGARVAAQGGTDIQVMEVVTDNVKGHLLNTLLLRGRGEDSIEVSPPEDLRHKGCEVMVKINYEVFVRIPHGGGVWHFSTPGLAVMPMEGKVRGGSNRGVRGIVPVTILPNSFVVGGRYKLKFAAGEGTMGNFACLALGGNGACVYEENLKYGYDGLLYIGDIVTTEPGNISGPTVRGIDYRINGHEDCTYSDHEGDCPRVVTIPVVNKISGGRADVIILGFAKFFLNEVGGEGNDCYIIGTYLGDGG